MGEVSIAESRLLYILRVGFLAGDYCAPLHICLKSAFIQQVAEASDIDSKRFDLVHCFGQQDLQLHQIGMMMFAELRSGGMMGQLYVESLTQILVIHVLRHYSTLTQPIGSQNSSLTRTQLHQAINLAWTRHAPRRGTALPRCHH
ncbi:hypothetical protein [Nostoc flagelliforme]|uniref:hypothetical protein n=1 Tax=Nostoc flagelliforme TaxID=1306274 RepID=UPI0018EF9310|nr:hypothetical protein [Nostoc flagelliforme]